MPATRLSWVSTAPTEAAASGLSGCAMGAGAGPHAVAPSEPGVTQTMDGCRDAACGRFVGPARQAHHGCRMCAGAHAHASCAWQLLRLEPWHAHPCARWTVRTMGHMVRSHGRKRCYQVGCDSCPDGSCGTRRVAHTKCALLHTDNTRRVVRRNSRFRTVCSSEMTEALQGGGRRCRCDASVLEHGVRTRGGFACTKVAC